MYSKSQNGELILFEAEDTLTEEKLSKLIADDVVFTVQTSLGASWVIPAEDVGSFYCYEDDVCKQIRNDLDYVDYMKIGWVERPIEVPEREV